MSTAVRHHSAATVLATIPAASDNGARRGEPVTFGLPLPSGLCFDAAQLTVHGPGPLPTQARTLDRWPDGSIRWALVDTQLDTPVECVVAVGQRAPACATPLSILADGSQISIDTGVVQCAIEPGPHLLVARDRARRDIVPRTVTPTFVGEHGEHVPVRLLSATVEASGPLRATVRIEGVVGSGQEPLLNLVFYVHAFAGSSCLRIEATVWNQRAARHPHGCWELGDPGSVLFRDFSLVIDHGDRHSRVFCQPAPGCEASAGNRLELYQDSSGGTHWQSSNHVNRAGEVPLRFRAFRLVCDHTRREGARAQPLVWTCAADGSPLVAVAVREFWQNFPKAIDTSATCLAVRLFPKQFADLHELQGGEQKTHVIGIDLAPWRTSINRVDWVAHPSIVSCSPEWYSACEAVPYLTPAAEDPHDAYLNLVNAAIDAPSALALKREVVDEFGWRNFGDLYADHESVDGDRPTVSHYNNQYDALAGFAIQFMRSGDARWWTAMQQLATHVADIDIYHTRRDKAAYNGGLFWHTYHYTDAGRSTHRSYPAAPGIGGGGPSAEHDYSTGLMLHYLLTGDDGSRRAVLSLADWVLAMDDGAQSRFRWLSRTDTGLASSTGAETYHGPGRGAGNSITTLLNAYRLTGQRRFMDKAETLIRRCVHPADDIATRHLENVELRWSYTVFLQALGKYLDEKAMRAEFDWEYAYAQSSLLHYARWMAEHEYPYLEKSERLEYPNETWAAQDMRKCEVFNLASRHARGEEQRLFAERAEFFFDASLKWLKQMPTRTRTRPLVLLLSHGWAHAAFHKGDAVEPLPSGDAGYVFGEPSRFVPQKTVAVRRAAYLAASGIVAVLAAVGWAIWPG